MITDTPPDEEPRVHLARVGHVPTHLDMRDQEDMTVECNVLVDHERLHSQISAIQRLLLVTHARRTSIHFSRCNWRRLTRWAYFIAEGRAGSTEPMMEASQVRLSHRQIAEQLVD